jgi:hypothetical protein
MTQSESSNLTTRVCPDPLEASFTELISNFGGRVVLVPPSQPTSPLKYKSPRSLMYNEAHSPPKIFMGTADRVAALRSAHNAMIKTENKCCVLFMKFIMVR